MGASQDTEITLGTGKLLGIFFLLAAICGAFFTMGYLFGRGSTPAPASTTVVSTVPSSPGNASSKPSASASKSADVNASCAADAANCASTNATPDPSTTNPGTTQAPASAPTLLPVKTSADGGSAASPVDVRPASNGTYMVQVAAVSRQEDAEILVNALRKKQYPVLIVGNGPGDSLFHVQVGPFSDPKEAEVMRSRLAADGYNAIVKK